MKNSHLTKNSAIDFMESFDFQTDAVQGFIYEIKSPNVFLEDIILGSDQREQISQIILEHKNSDKLTSFGGLTPTNKIFLEGVSGCGKTITALAIASELGRGIVIVNLNEIVSSKLGETSKNLQKVISFASKNNYIIFFDEFDSLSRSRSDEKELGEMKRIVNGIIQLLDFGSSNSLIIAASNHLDQIDRAITRRFEKFINFTKPDMNQIKQYLTMIEFNFSGKIKIRKNKELIKKLEDFDFFTIKTKLFTIVKKKVLVSQKENNETIIISSSDLI